MRSIRSQLAPMDAEIFMKALVLSQFSLFNTTICWKYICIKQNIIVRRQIKIDAPRLFASKKVSPRQQVKSPEVASIGISAAEVAQPIEDLSCARRALNKAIIITAKKPTGMIQYPIDIQLASHPPNQR